MSLHAHRISPDWNFIGQPRTVSDDRRDSLRDTAVQNVLNGGGLADFLGDSPFADEVICNAITATSQDAQSAVARLREQFDITMGVAVEAEIDRLMRAEREP